jgi:hypothetical protein
MQEAQLRITLGSVADDNAPVLDDLIDLFQNNTTVVPFVGAGLSIPSGFPGWAAFLSSLADSLGTSKRLQISHAIGVGQYEEAAELLAGWIGDNALRVAIRHAFGVRAFSDQRIQGSVEKLPDITCGPVITTNFDRVLERTFELSGEPFQDVISDPAHHDVITSSFQLNRHVLLKLHGDAEDRAHQILTLREYVTYYGDSRASKIDYSLPLPSSLRWIFQHRPVLFIGCSLNSDRTVSVLETIDDFAAHYAILPAPQSDFAERKKFLGVSPEFLSPPSQGSTPSVGWRGAFAAD